MSKGCWGLAVLGALISIEAALLLSGSRVLVLQVLVHPRVDYQVPGYGNVREDKQATLVCRYFTGRGFVNKVLAYSPRDTQGSDECAFLAGSPSHVQAKAGDSSSSAADWVSGIGSLGAVIVALGGYWWAERQRKHDLKGRRIASGNQIGVKLHDLLGRSQTINKHLYAPYEGPPLLGADGKRNLWGEVRALVGLSDQISADLIPEEQNLLIELEETDFLTRFSVAWQRHQSIVLSMKEFYIKRDAAYALMPPPMEMDELVGRHAMTHEELMRFMPYSAALDLLIRTVMEMSAENFADIDRLAERFHPMMKRHFPDRKFLKIADPEEEGDRSGQLP